MFLIFLIGETSGVEQDEDIVSALLNHLLGLNQCYFILKIQKLSVFSYDITKNFVLHGIKQLENKCSFIRGERGSQERCFIVLWYDTVNKDL